MEQVTWWVSILNSKLFTVWGVRNLGAAGGGGLAGVSQVGVVVTPVSESLIGAGGSVSKIVVLNM